MNNNHHHSERGSADYGKYNTTYQNLSHLPFEDTKYMLREIEQRVSNQKVDLRNGNVYLKDLLNRVRVNKIDDSYYRLNHKKKAERPIAVETETETEERSTSPLFAWRDEPIGMVGGTPARETLPRDVKKKKNGK